MLIVCPACATEYTLDADRVGSKGRIVRCARCRTSWFASAEDPAFPPRTAGGAPELRPTVIDAADPPPPAIRKHAPVSKRTKRAAASAALGISAGTAASVVAATVALVLAGTAFRVPIVRAVPATASLFALAGLPVNVVGLSLDDVVSAFGDESGRKVLVTEGTIVNVTRHDVAVPDLELTIQADDAGMLYQWSTRPPVAEIAAGESAKFAVRLASPPPAGARVLVAFRPAAP